MMVINCNNILHLDGFTNGVNVLIFATDADGDKIVGVEVLNDVAFAEIHDELAACPQILYKPIETDII